MNEASMIGGNSKYIILIKYHEITAYTIEEINLNEVCRKTCEFRIKGINLNKKYENIFLIISEGAFRIFEISKVKTNYSCEVKIKIITTDTIDIENFQNLMKR